MKLEIHIHLPSDDSLHRKVDAIMLSQAEMEIRMDAAIALTGKLLAEAQNQKVILAQLREELANLGPISPAVEAKLIALEQGLANVDAVNDDL